MKDSSVIVPDFEKQTAREQKVATQVEQAEKGLTADEKALANLASSEGWKVLKQDLCDEIKTLSEDLTSFISTGADFQSVGQRAVVANILTEKYNQLISRVESTAIYEQEHARSSKQDK